MYTSFVLVTEEVVSYFTWDETVDAMRWVIADAESGVVLQADGELNDDPIATFEGAGGEVITVTRRRYLGFVIKRFDPRSGVQDQIAAVDEDSFWPWTAQALGGGLIGVGGYELGSEGSQEHPRLMVLDSANGATVLDVTLEDLVVREGPVDGPLDDAWFHYIVWDPARSRALVVHADEEAITEVAIPSGETNRIELAEPQSFLGRILSRLVPPAQAKILVPSNERYAVISGDRLFISGAVTTKAGPETAIEYSLEPTGLFAVDLETMEIVARSDTPIGFVDAAPTGGYLLGGAKYVSGVLDANFWAPTERNDGLSIIDPATLEVINTYDFNTGGVFTIAVSRHGTVLYAQSPQGATIFDAVTGETTTVELRGEWHRTMIAAGLIYGGDW
jgi:hypothetical protein